jgi:hypothetical protein
MPAEAHPPPSSAVREPARAAGMAPGARLTGRVDPSRHGLRAAGLGISLAALALPMLVACGSSSSGQPGAQGATTSAACATLGAALSDGPDPAADPVGYAEAQLKPLRAIQTSDHGLAAAIRDLAAAYARVFATNGTSAAAGKAVTAAVGRVNAICPGSAP